MEIVDLSDEYEHTYCRCLEDWSEEMKEAGDYKETWLERKKKEGLRVKLARNEAGQLVGMIHYAPIAAAPAVGIDLYYVYCIWIHGYKEGVGNFQKRGIGSALLEAAEADAKSLGAKGLAAWGIMLPFFMRSSWFKKRGYRRADKEGMIELVWKPFSADAVSPTLLRMKKKPAVTKDRVTVTCFRNGWCPAQNLACERMKRAVSEQSGKVDYVEIDTDNRENLAEWGIADGIFIDDKAVAFGPPPTYDKLRKTLQKKLKRVKTTAGR
jgi:GNAT superfamily N-acetyltransferase